MALAYFSHLFCLVALWLTMGAFIIVFAVHDYRAVCRAELNWRQFDQRFRRLILRTLFAALPTIALMCALVLWQTSDPIPAPGLKSITAFPAAHLPVLSQNPLDVLGELPSTFISVSADERLPAMEIILLIACLFAACLCYKLYRRAWDRCDVMLLLIVFFIALACLASDVRAREFFVRPRALLFTCLLAILWIGVQPLATRSRAVVAILAVGITLMSFAVQSREHQRQSAYLQEYLSIAPHLESNTTFLPLFASGGWFTEDNQRVSVQVSPFVHAAGYLAAARDCIDLHNYEANTDHFPILFRARKNPYAILGRGIELQPPRLDLNQSSTVHIDYILLWGDRTGANEDDFTRALSTWHLIFRSPHHDARLYRNPHVR